MQHYNKIKFSAPKVTIFCSIDKFIVLLLNMIMVIKLVTERALKHCGKEYMRCACRKNGCPQLQFNNSWMISHAFKFPDVQISYCLRYFELHFLDYSFLFNSISILKALNFELSLAV